MLRCGHVRAKLLWYLVKSYYNTIMRDCFTSFFLPHMAATKKEDYFMGTQMENTRTKTPQFYILVNLHLSPTLSNHHITHEKIISG